MNLWWSPFLLKSQPGTFLKKTPSSQVFFYDLCKVFQNSYSTERWWTATSEGIAYKTKTDWMGQLIIRIG